MGSSVAVSTLLFEYQKINFFSANNNDNKTAPNAQQVASSISLGILKIHLTSLNTGALCPAKIASRVNLKLLV